MKEKVEKISTSIRTKSKDCTFGSKRLTTLFALELINTYLIGNTPKKYTYRCRSKNDNVFSTSMYRITRENKTSWIYWLLSDYFSKKNSKITLVANPAIKYWSCWLHACFPDKRTKCPIMYILHTSSSNHLNHIRIPTIKIATECSSSCLW